MKLIDWESCLKLANNDPIIAEKLLSMFMCSLDAFIAQSNQYISQKDFNSLAKQVHKLHGAACYVGVPEVKNLAWRVENVFHSTNVDYNNLSTLLSEFNKVITKTKDCYQKKSYLGK